MTLSMAIQLINLVTESGYVFGCGAACGAVAILLYFYICDINYEPEKIKKTIELPFYP